MLKCGQQGNKKYTFGLRDEQKDGEDIKTVTDITCLGCGKNILCDCDFCPKCGLKLPKK